SAMTLEVRGNKGVQTISLTSGESLAQVVTAFNTMTGMTGVTAALINGNANSGIVFQSTNFGSDSFVSVKRQSSPGPGVDSFLTYALSNNAPVPSAAPFNWANPALTQTDHDSGKDVTALINGTLATGHGLDVSINTAALGMDLTLTQAMAT